MLICDEIKPNYLKDFIINENISNKLTNLCKNNLFNILLYGPEGSGKFTLLKGLINTYFNEDVKINITNFKISVNNINKNINLNTSIYHYEFIIDRYFISKKSIYISLLNYLTKYNNVNFNEENTIPKIILIRNLHYANYEFINLIKNLLDKKTTSVIFFLTCEKMNNTRLIKPFLTTIRIPSSNDIIIKKCIDNYLYKKQINITNKKINTLFDTDYKINNLNEIFIKLESQILNIKYEDILISTTKKLINLIEKKDIKNIQKIREILYDLLSKNINIEKIFKLLIDYFIKSNHNNKEKFINIIIKYNKYYVCGYKNIIHIEALLINLMNIIE